MSLRNRLETVFLGASLVTATARLPAQMTPTPSVAAFPFFSSPSPTATVFIPYPVLSPNPRSAGNLSPSNFHPPSYATAGARKHPALRPILDGYFATSDHVKLHYLESGRGLTLVFVPGWLLPGDIWAPQLEDLSRDFHVVALDPRSQGLSEMTHQGDEPLREARDLQELLDHLKVPSAVLVGWSHGAFQVLAYMGEFGTDRLFAVALVDSPLAPASTAPGADTQRGRFLERFVKDRKAASRNFIWGLFKTPPPGSFIKKLDQSADRTPTDIALALMNNVFPGDKWEPSIPVLRQVPMLYAVTPKYNFQAQYLTVVDPQAQVEFFERSGHALFVDEADHFNGAMRSFLKGAALYPAGVPERPGNAAKTPKRQNGGTPNVP
jgi:non-heme chloroperoxidase